MMYIKIIVAGLAIFCSFLGMEVHGQDGSDAEYWESIERVWFEPGRATGSSSRCCSSVLFIPGFKGTRLFDGNRQLWEPNSNSDVRELFLDENGQSINQSIITGDMIQRTNVGFGVFDTDIYAGISSFFDSLEGSGVIKNWDVLEYDWRLDLPMSQEVFLKIRDLAQHSYDGKVMLVGHSNGGLMVKKILSVVNPEFRDIAISSAVLVATPQLGSAQAIPSMLHGDGESLALGLYLNKETAREWGRNMPGAYNLLPSARFLSLKNTPLISFEDGTSLGGFSELANFLSITQPDGFSLNTGLLLGAISNHENLDNLTQQDFGVPMYEIAGVNYPTISGLQYSTLVSCALTAGPTCIPVEKQDHKTLKTSVGDGVVELKSVLTVNSESLNSGLASVFVFNLGIFNSVKKENIHHATVLEAGPVQDLIKSIIQKDLPQFNSVFVQNYPDSSEESDGSNQALYTFGVHSPVTLHITDSGGRTTERGKTEIPNSVYEEVGEGKYITILDPEVEDGNSLKVLIQGTEDGSFSFDIQKTVGELVTTEALFSHIGISSSTHARLKYSADAGITHMEVDFEGDGLVDELRKNEVGEPNIPVEEPIKNRLKRVGNRTLETVQSRFKPTKKHESHEDKDADTEDNNEQDVWQVGSHSDESVCYPC